MSILWNRKRNRNGNFIKKPMPQSQQVAADPLLLKNIADPVMKKITSEIKTINFELKKKETDIVVDLKKELVYKRDLEVKQKFSKGKFIVALEPSEKQEFYLMRLKECLNIKRGIAWVDFYDISDMQEDSMEFTLQDEGLVKWENMVALLNIKVKPTEVVHVITLNNSNGLLKKINQMAGLDKPKKRSMKAEGKSSKMEEEKGESDSGSEFESPSESSATESINLLQEDSEEEKIDTNVNKNKRKFKKRIKKTPAQKAAIEHKKRIDAEEIDRCLNPDYVENGIRIVKTRLGNDGVTEETVELDPTRKEIRPKKWKFIEREEENKELSIVDEELMRLGLDSNLLFMNDSFTTTNRNIIRAALTDNAELAKLCIQELEAVPSLMESWSPEIKSTAVELCISHNSRKVLELLLNTKDRPNTEDQLLIRKFDTGQVSDRAFGTRVRKVEMMRGGRQGNNAFMQDNRRKEEYKTIQDQLLNDEILAVRAAYS